MQVVEVDINILKPAEYNPRAMTEKEAKDLKESLESFDMVEPIVVNSNKDRENVIIGGHQRYFILKEMGRLTAPVVYIDLSLERERLLNLRLNKNLGHWDWDMLANFDREVLEEAGFGKYEINEIFDLVLTKDEATGEAEKVENFMTLNFEDCEEMDKAEAEIKEVLDKHKIKYKVNC